MYGQARRKELQWASVGSTTVAYLTKTVMDKRKQEDLTQYHDMCWADVPDDVRAAAAKRDRG